MKTIERQKTQNTTAHDDVNQASKIGLAAVTILGGLIGAWGMACMVGALATGGVGSIVTGFISAVTGM